jgi:polyhydroxyalkanoate synthesis regulator phasin
MPSKLREGYLTGLGIVAVTYEKASEVTKKLIKKGELAKEKQKKFASDLLNEGKKNTSEMINILENRIEYLARKGEPLLKKQDKIIRDVGYKARETGDITQEKLKKIIKEAKEKTGSLREKIAKTDRDKIKDALVELNIPTKDNLDEIRNKLDRLISDINKKENSGQEDKD